MYENIDKKLFTLEEYKSAIESLQKDKNGKIVILYTTDKELQDAYIQAASKKGYDVLAFDEMIDQHFIQHMESKNSDYKFSRVDAELDSSLIRSDDTPEIIAMDIPEIIDQT